MMDFCPVYDGYENGLCSSQESEIVIRANEVERFGLRNSRCLVGNVFPFYRNTALCLPIACVLEDRSLRIKVGENWHICKDADQVIQSGSVNITCPDPIRICPTFFCPYDCLGTGGECDYTSGNCLCHYENVTHPGETVLDICGIEEETKELENITSTGIVTTLRPILQRKGKIDLMMPPSDTKFSDYYVADVLHLDDVPRLIDAWGILILSIIAFALACFFVTLFLFKTALRDACNCLFFWKSKRSGPSQDADGIGRESSIQGTTRNKHKMVASVLVDLRIRQSDNNNANNSGGGTNWRRRIRTHRGRHRQRRDLNESLAETDGRMTDSEVDSSAAAAMSDSMSETSSRQMLDESTTLSDAEGVGSDDVVADFNDTSNTTTPLANEVDLLSIGAAGPEAAAPRQQPAAIRRRRFVPSLFT